MLDGCHKSDVPFFKKEKRYRYVYDTQHNYLIEYNEQCKDKTYCAVYFCSNDLYYLRTISESVWKTNMDLFIVSIIAEIKLLYEL